MKPDAKILLIGGPERVGEKIPKSVRRFDCSCPGLLDADPFGDVDTIVVWPNSRFLTFGSQADWDQCSRQTLPPNFWKFYENRRIQPKRAESHDEALGSGFRRVRGSEFANAASYERDVQVKEVYDHDDATNFARYLHQKAISRLHECVTAASKGARLIVLLAPPPENGRHHSENALQEWVCDHISVKRTSSTKLAASELPVLRDTISGRLLTELCTIPNGDSCCLFEIYRGPSPTKLAEWRARSASPGPKHRNRRYFEETGLCSLESARMAEALRPGLNAQGKWGDIVERYRARDEDEASSSFTLLDDGYYERWPAALASYELAELENRRAQTVGLHFRIGSGSIIVSSAPKSVVNVVDSINDAAKAQRLGKPVVQEARYLSKTLRKMKSEAGQEKATVKKGPDRDALITAFNHYVARGLSRHKAAILIAGWAKDPKEGHKKLGLTKAYPKLSPDALKRYAGVKDNPRNPPLSETGESTFASLNSRRSIST